VFAFAGVMAALALVRNRLAWHFVTALRIAVFRTPVAAVALTWLDHAAAFRVAALDHVFLTERRL
jgi:hypothetical protein